MNLFKSILSEDPDPGSPDDSEKSQINPSPKHQQQQIDRVDDDDDDDSNLNPNSSSVWSFGDLMKTLTTRSESVLETYRRDLKEFGSGLKKETSLFREAASRAVKELPASIEVGASAIDGVLKSTADIISQGKDALLAPSDVESDASESQNYSDRTSLNSRRYSRFDSQLISIQNDVRTYCEEPEDLDDYSKWKLGFVLDDKKEEIENLIGDNGGMEGIYKKVVPNEVDQETFWYRYFYRMHKLKQQEDLRANLVKRSLSAEDDEELTWEVDEEEEEVVEEATKTSKPNDKELPQIGNKEIGNDNEKSEIGSSGIVDETGGKNASVGSVDKVNVVEPSGERSSVSDEKVKSVPKSDEKVVDNGESGKDSDVSVVSTQPSLQEEEDLGWDEIEDLGSNDEKKVSQGESPNKADLRKRLSTAEEDEDLSWDIEDDDEPVKV